MTIARVCSSCFGDADLRAWIRQQSGKRGCDACGKFDSPTCDLEELCGHIQACLETYWGYAVEQLPYETAGGGYLGATWDTYDLLVNEVGISLPRDKKNRLFQAVLGGLTDELWCDYDWGSLDYDDALQHSWERFCETVKHKRRFFFHSDGEDDRDSYTAASLLNAIASISQSIGLIRNLPKGMKLWRARPDIKPRRRVKAVDFGPPPIHLANQSNRMNPPGIPMLYLASTARTALKETRAAEAKIGQWTLARPLRVLDLRSLPPTPGLFSGADRYDRLALRFLHSFAGDVMKPVARDNRTHIDYLPSQVVTEFFRDFPFEGGRVDGIAYESTVHRRGWNVALFLSPIELGLEKPAWGKSPKHSLNFSRAVRIATP